MHRCAEYHPKADQFYSDIHKGQAKATKTPCIKEVAKFDIKKQQDIQNTWSTTINNQQEKKDGTKIGTECPTARYQHDSDEDKGAIRQPPRSTAGVTATSSQVERLNPEGPRTCEIDSIGA
jgi:hypothetical protein